ncbi:MAG TPA: NTP transferase domain-containing protein [Dehalococcoidia bacterium]|nr:NTP transferase domain-containing protein [Dehalococcoidia bacterium]
MSRPTVLVLAGGASNRFWPLRDKLFFELGAQSLLERHLRQLRGLGCERFIVVTRPDTVDAVQTLGRGAGAGLRVVVQNEPKGMADAVLAARESLDHDPIYVTQAHDVSESLHAEMLAAWDKRGSADGLVAAARVDSYFPGGYLMLDGDRVTSIVEKPGAGNEPSDLVNIVAHAFASPAALIGSLLQEMSTPGADDAYERAVSKLMAAGDFRAHVYEGRWQALKYPWHLLDVANMLLDLWTSGAESPGPDYEQREDGVFIGRDVRIMPGAHVVAPALVGHGSVIGHNALVRGSIVSPNCVVGFGSEVARSFLGAGVELHHNYIGDSVIDAGASLGWGATTANYRIDRRSVPSMVGGERIDTGREKLGLVLGADAKVGVNTSTMPGVKIGAGALIGASIKVTRDVPDNERVLDEETYGRY